MSESPQETPGCERPRIYVNIEALPGGVELDFENSHMSADVLASWHNSMTAGFRKLEQVCGDRSVAFSIDGQRRASISLQGTTLQITAGLGRRICLYADGRCEIFPQNFHSSGRHARVPEPRYLHHRTAQHSYSVDQAISHLSPAKIKEKGIGLTFGGDPSLVRELSENPKAMYDGLPIRQIVDSISSVVLNAEAALEGKIADRQMWDGLQKATRQTSVLAQQTRANVAGVVTATNSASTDQTVCISTSPDASSAASDTSSQVTSYTRLPLGEGDPNLMTNHIATPPKNRPKRQARSLSLLMNNLRKIVDKDLE